MLLHMRCHLTRSKHATQVNMTILKAATRDFRGLPSDEALAETAREARCAAFACGASLVLATQEKESIFAIPLKGSNNSDPAGQPKIAVWHALSDAHTAIPEPACTADMAAAESCHILKHRLRILACTTASCFFLHTLLLLSFSPALALQLFQFC